MLGNIEITVVKEQRDFIVTIEKLGAQGPPGSGKSAYEFWLEDNPNGTREDYYEFNRGDAFEYEDFTPEQLEGLKLRFEDLSQAEKDSLKLTFDQLTPAEKLELKGEDGEPFVYSDFTEPQIEDLKARVIMPQTEYEALPIKENKIYYTY